MSAMECKKLLDSLIASKLLSKTFLLIDRMYHTEDKTGFGTGTGTGNGLEGSPGLGQLTSGAAEAGQGPDQCPPGRDRQQEVDHSANQAQVLPGSSL